MIKITNNYVRFMIELINKNVIFASELKLTGRNCLSTNEDAKDLLGEFFLIITTDYSIVKDNSADLGVNFKIVQDGPTVKAVCTKISKKNFLHICQYFYISERK